jgi:hypothetical protein
MVRGRAAAGVDTDSVADDAVIIGVTGIVVSGVIGPAVAASMARRGRSREFHREQAAARRNQLRALLDEAASLLASGPTHLRVLQGPKPDSDDLQRARSWLLLVFPIGQRLRLWLPANHPVVEGYENVRRQLVSAAESGRSADRSVLDDFEQERSRFLEVCRETLLSPVPERGPAL